MTNLDELYKQYAGIIYKHCIKLAKNKLLEADDLAQETWLRITKYISYYDHNRSFPAWAKTIATRTMIDLERKDENRPYFCDTIWDRPDTREEVSLGRAEELLSPLSNEEKDIIIKVYLEGYTLAELASLHGVKPATLRKRMERIREKIKEKHDGLH